MSDEIQADYIPAGTLDHYAYNEADAVWYVVGEVFETWGGGVGRDATNYAVAMVGDTGGHFVGDFDVNTDAGHYYITTKIRAAGALGDAADDDTVFGNGEIWWNGSVEQTETEYELTAYGVATAVEVLSVLNIYDESKQTRPGGTYPIIEDGTDSSGVYP